MTDFDRRTMMGVAGAALMLPASLRAREAGFSWQALAERARRLAASPFVDTPPYPAAAKVGYDAVNQARFRDDRTIWGDLLGATGIRLFPLSGTAQQPVRIALIEQGRVSPLRYDPGLFDIPAGNAVGGLGADAGFAGFRIMNAARDGDWLSFLGASYFRAPSPQGQFGLSARAIAINTSLGEREEFPRFTHFWIERTGDSAVRVYALLDGASVTGAFRFDNVLAREGVRQDVTAALFLRRPVEEIGLMPMTSMFWYDQAQRARSGDWRPEVHDSDLLAFLTREGQHHARPLVNPSTTRLSRFGPAEPAGFGLLQRDRKFAHYQDDGVFYDRRPSLWATPHVAPDCEMRLWEFGTVNEYVDNIGAYLTPRTMPLPGRRIDLRYRLDWSASRAPGGGAAAILEDIWLGATEQPQVQRLVLDFADIPSGTKPDLWSEIVGGEILHQAAYAVQGMPHLYRVTLDIRHAGPADLRAQLRVGNGAFSEYVHYPLGA
ncbi:MAG: glucan biosynthesis protein [Sphingobium sp.]